MGAGGSVAAPTGGSQHRSNNPVLCSEAKAADRAVAPGGEVGSVSLRGEEEKSAHRGDGASPRRGYRRGSGAGPSTALQRWTPSRAPLEEALILGIMRTTMDIRLVEAAARGDVTLVERLLRQGAKPNARHAIVRRTRSRLCPPMNEKHP